jgi:hypothetical protein
VGSKGFDWDGSLETLPKAIKDIDTNIIQICKTTSEVVIFRNIFHLLI